MTPGRRVEMDDGLITWVYALQKGIDRYGDPRRIWLRRDGLGRWIVTSHFRSIPDFYLDVDGEWQDRLTESTRHDFGTAHTLALAHLDRSPEL